MVLGDSEDFGEPGIVDRHHLGLALPLSEHEQILNVLYRSKGLLPQLQLTGHLRANYRLVNSYCESSISTVAN